MKRYLLQNILLVILIFLCSSLRIHQKNSEQNHQQKLIKTSNKHNYYNIEQTTRVSQSRSIQYLNKCKNLCLQMHQLFPFQFKYHRLVYRQPDGLLKYITGECLYTFRKSEDKNEENKKSIQKQNKTQKSQEQTAKERKWFPWSNLKNFIDLAIVQDDTTSEQRKAWTQYSSDCEDESEKLSQSSRQQLKFTLVHSDFQYYQNTGFSNLSPFDDLDQLMAGLSSVKL